MPSARDFITNDWELWSLDATYTYTINHDKPGADSTFKRNYGFSFDKRTKLIEESGYVYAEALAASKKLPDEAFESWLCGKLMQRIDLGDLYSSSQLLDILDSLNPKNAFLRRFREWVGSSENLIARMSSEPEIHFREDGKNARSLDDFVAPYRGRVVVLGLWMPVGDGNAGWFEFNRGLQKKYAGKDVQFAYISTGNSDSTNIWLDRIYDNKLEGDHVMLDWGWAANFGPLVREGDSIQDLRRHGAVPFLYIYDRSGKLVMGQIPWSWYKQKAYSTIDSLLVRKGPKYGSGAEISSGVRIRPDYLSISNLESLIKPYQGKVVYMDLWGTWCGPCLMQMEYEKALYKRYRAKDIVFLFVDRDEQNADSTWRRLIKEKGIRGDHVRLTGQQISYIWGNLPTSSDAYPSYFIFDRAGELVEKNAKWPGDKEELYQQLDGVLRKPSTSQ